jgi:hypothetical protein
VRRRVDLDVEEQPTGEERDRGTGGANSASTLPKMIATTAAARVYTRGRKGHDPPTYVAMPEFLGSEIRATVVGWKRASSGHR